jgi:dienelactone hydrolase
MMRSFIGVLLVYVASSFTWAGEAGLSVGARYQARDTLAPPTAMTPDVVECLQGITYPVGDFTVVLEPNYRDETDWLVRFPSPRPSLDSVVNNVAMEWSLARDSAGKPIKAPAVVIIHESGRGMTAARLFGKGLRRLVLHTFVIHLPNYGARTPATPPTIRELLPSLQQAVSDVRRARDAVAALPFVDASLIALQGISLGGFVAATVAGVDRGYHRVFVLLAGGNLADVIQQGAKDAAMLRRQLESAGISVDEIVRLARGVEPMRLAHRVDAGSTWLFSAKFDEVVPPKCSLAFAEAAGLQAVNHHYALPVGHYSAAVLLPAMMKRIGELMVP